MKPRMLIALFTLLMGMGTTLSAQVTQADLLGSWANDDGQVVITVTYKKDGKMIMAIDTPDQSFEINGTYELKGDQITISMEQGPWDCEAGAKGVYKMAVDGDKCTVSPVSDECYDRQPPGPLDFVRV